MARKASFTAWATWGWLDDDFSVPTAPAIVSEDHEDGTGVTITLSGYDPGTTNELFVALDGESFVSYGTTWISDQKVLSLDNGAYWAYVVSSSANACAASSVIRVFSTDAEEAATDNVSTAVKAMKQTAVYWPPEDEWDKYGKPIPQDPIEISVRWEEKVEEFIDENGTKQMSKAKLIVDRDLKNTGILMLGELADVIDYTHPKENPDSWEIKQFSKIPNLRGNKFLRQVYL